MSDGLPPAGRLRPDGERGRHRLQRLRRRVDLDGVQEILAAARDTGVTLLDTADIYGAPAGG